MRLAALALMTMTAPAWAEATFCTAMINGQDVLLGYDTAEPGLRGRYSMRERLATKWGRHDCPSYVVLRSLTPELDDDGRQPFCLRMDASGDSVMGYDLGDRDAWGRCRAPRKTACERVNATKDAAAAMTGAAARATVSGLQALPDGSGAVILSGSGEAITGALGTIGGAASAIAASPALIAGTAVSVVAVGGAVYACRERD
ncbi:hypothetical protein [Paracoccus sp. (in: a-proteobacteria)]|uniref:hypothetical protein n=1 Tax=Paracoccus sp. TaxID=267 RepID=UPI0026E047CF|nr:hypothetical protein [Paracoccus sp. (in: a-proteobacteria)]MDO5648771.1 hypothetical protein [Paracoccus sp. (in: a-proteobacteria)]